MKTCFKCGQAKPRKEFYRHPMMGDGLLGKCKTCTRADSTAGRLARLDQYRAYDRARGRRAGDPVKESARVAVRKALVSGVLVKPLQCEDCGETPAQRRNLQAHHEDYAKPLDVIWVCTKCHGLRHGSDVISGLHQVIHFRFEENA